MSIDDIADEYLAKKAEKTDASVMPAKRLPPRAARAVVARPVVVQSLPPESETPIADLPPDRKLPGLLTAAPTLKVVPRPATGSIAETEPGRELVELLEEADRPHPPAPDEAIRFSRLRKMARSSMHFAYAREDEASHLDIGSASHSMVLGGVRVISYPGKVRNGKAWEQFQADNPDALILSRRELATATGMADAIRKNKDAMRVLDGEREKTLLWRNQGRLCRGTPDVRGQCGPEHFVTELKTGETSDPRSFVWKVLRFAYHGQLGWYSDGAVLSGLDEPSAHYIVAVEAKSPHVVTVFRLTPKSIEKGRRLVRIWFEQLLNCEKTNEWPPYVQSVVDLDLPEENLEIFEASIPVSEDVPF